MYVGNALDGVAPEAWTDAVTGVIGGKTGGKGPSRQGAGTQPEKLDEAVSEAEKWISEKLKDLSL